MPTRWVDELGFERAERRATLETLMEALAARERQALRLRFEENLTHAEIGAIIGAARCRSNASSGGRSSACATPQSRR